ncbi:glycosyltransferase [Alistipes sp. ZOR0009]|uniref:glycosyltransferase n=1 Tax=Alistipes sp. ZOR0009 TaxID=1339253 RepID=UPI0006474D1D|nr:glycosyltransferase [Alistipes sp. ZOR0009]
MVVLYSCAFNTKRGGGPHTHVQGIYNSEVLKPFLKLIIPGNNNINTFYKDNNRILIGPNTGIWILNLLLFELFASFQLFKEKFYYKNTTILYYRPHYTTLLQPIIARILRIKVIKEINGISELETNIKLLKYISRYLEKFYSKIADKNIAVSKGIADYYVNKYNINRNKLVVIPNGIDKNIIQNTSKSNLCKNDTIKLVFVGHLAKWQGVYEFIVASHSLLKKYNIDFYVVGNGDQQHNIELFIKNNSINNIKIMGWVSHAESIEIIKNSHVGFLCRPGDENMPLGSPLKLFEFIGLGKAILATNVDGIGNLEKISSNFYYISYNDSNSIEEVFKKWRSNPSKILESGAVNFEICKNEYTWDQTCKKIFDLI